MPLNERLAGVNAQWGLLTAYQKFEQVIILILTAMIAVVVVLAVWNLALKILFGIALEHARPLGLCSVCGATASCTFAA